jgi:hypothetical protein
MAHYRVINIYCSLKIIFLHVDVKERTGFVSMKFKSRSNMKNGGPDRTRTYDPRLIKAVL